MGKPPVKCEDLSCLSSQLRKKSVEMSTKADGINALAKLKSANAIAKFLIGKKIKIKRGYTGESCPLALYFLSLGYTNVSVEDTITLDDEIIDNSDAVNTFITRIDIFSEQVKDGGKQSKMLKDVYGPLLDSGFKQ